MRDALAEILEVHEAAALLGMGPRQVERYCAANTLAARQLRGGAWVTTRAAVKSFRRPARGRRPGSKSNAA